MTIRHLKIFIRVAETGSMSQAARSLYLSQPTVSQAIRELEEHYDTLLFDRLSKHLYITENGKKLLAMARTAVLEFDQLELSMQTGTRTERFRVGTTITIGTCLLSRFLNDFYAARPQTEVFSYIGNTHQVEEKLLAAELDVGIVEGRIHSPELISLPMINDYLVLACSISHPFACRTNFLPEDLSGKDFVMRERGSGTRALFEDYLRDHHISVNCRIEAPFSEAMKNAILYNDCLAVISVRLIENELKAGTIHAILNPEQAWDRTFNLVYHKDRPVSDSISLTEELLKRYSVDRLDLPL